jgi:membrane associated rhomboid family serine protease
MYMRWAIYIVIFGLLPGFRIDNAAHIGGLVAGFGTAYLIGTPRREGALREKVWRVAALLCILLTGFSFLKMFLFFSRVSG